jgi:hypothetical protein
MTPVPLYRYRSLTPRPKKNQDSIGNHNKNYRIFTTGATFFFFWLSAFVVLPTRVRQLRFLTNFPLSPLFDVISSVAIIIQTSFIL